MTNLTSEQYRDVLHHIHTETEPIPSIQSLLRRAVVTFYERFGTYPKVAGVAPGKIGIFGDQIQFNGGVALPVATPMATVVVGKRATGTRFTVATSAIIPKPRKVNFSFSKNRPLGPGCPSWLNHVKGVIENYREDEVPPFDAAIESSVPVAVGFGSTSAVQIAMYSFLEILVGKKSDPLDKAKACQNAEKEFLGRGVGLVDRMNSTSAKDRHFTWIDCKTNQVEWISFNDPKISLVAVDFHLKDTVLGGEYPDRTRYIKKACEILGLEDLRSCTEEHLKELEVRVGQILDADEDKSEEGEKEEKNLRGKEKENEKKEGEEEGEDDEELGEEEMQVVETWTKQDYEVMIKRARFFVMEMIRIKEAVEAWKGGNAEVFGQKMIESHRSLKEDFDFDNPFLDFFVETSLKVEGVLGSRMTGMGLGFGGGIISLVKKKNVKNYVRYMTEKFKEFESALVENLKEQRISERLKFRRTKRKIMREYFNPVISSSERLAGMEIFLSEGGLLPIITPKTMTLIQKRETCQGRRIIPCTLDIKLGRCGTWAHQSDKGENYRKSLLFTQYDERPNKDPKGSFWSGKLIADDNNMTREFSASIQAQHAESAKSILSRMSQFSDIMIPQPNFYLISPFAGARMMFVTKSDILRSIFANPVPDPKKLVETAMESFEEKYGNKPEAVGLAPGTIIIFGEFMEFHLGCIVSMALPMMTVVVGGRNDAVRFSATTLATDAQEPKEMDFPIPSVRPLRMESRKWANYFMSPVNEFKGHVPGFNAVVHTSVPFKVGVNSCAALQASVYTFLECMTKECTEDPFEKADRCSKSECEFTPVSGCLVTNCSSIKFIPTFLSREGHLMFINCKRYRVSHYFFDHPSYAFLICTCKQNDTKVNLESLEKRLKQCIEALDVLGKTSLLTTELKHLRCLKKRELSDEIVKRVRYVITEHQRTIEAVKAIKDENYRRIGLLMSESHASLRDDYEVSSPQIENLIRLASNVKEVLGAKMLGKGLHATVLILIRLADADKCIRYMRKNYQPENDKPVFYITKPSRGAFAMNPDVDVPYVP